MSADVLRRAAVREGVVLEIFTVVWMAIEAAIAISAGIVARSVLLTAFGLDSTIELISGATLLWRLSAEARSADLGRVERVEKRAIWISAVLLILLSAALAATSIIGLVMRFRPEGSWAGLGISAAAIIVMPLLARRKRAANRTIQSSALRADIAESITCAYMAGATLVGVGLSTVLGLWWAEYVAALLLLVFIGREAREALEAARAGRGRCEDDEMVHPARPVPP
ncbi:MAG: cation transporter [Candidatus Dormibacteraeota bacterium]|nr:cation transporter [Candidatus Dormibacteraeota bacterium]